MNELLTTFGLVNSLILSVGILWGVGLLRFFLVVRASESVRRGYGSLEALGVLSQLANAISIAAIAGVIYVWIVFYRGVVALGLPVAG